MPRRLEGSMRRIIFALLRYTGAARLTRYATQRRRPTILLFHQQDPERFDRNLRCLRRRYSIITMDRLLDALESRDLRSLPPYPLVITFDDGRASNAALIPLFTKYSVRPTVFVTTGVVGTNRHFWWTHLTREEVSRLQALDNETRVAALMDAGLNPESTYDEPQALSTEELARLATVADIQPHTRSHPVLTACTLEQVRAEVEGSASDVTETIGRVPRVFAYPNGAVDNEVASVVAKCGIPFAVTTEPRLVTGDADPLRLPRIFVRDDADTSELIVFASGLQAILRRRFA